MSLADTASGVLSSGEIRDEGVDLTFLMWLTARGTTALMDATVAAAGLTGDEFAVYSILASSETTTPSTLSRWMAAPPTTVSSYVKRFETRGHVSRVPNPDDRRSYRIVLTEAGKAAHHSAHNAFRPVRDALVRALGETTATSLSTALLTFRPIVDILRQPDTEPDHQETDQPR
jgi:DNA-binding MarR family transcriptional regulator